MDFIVQTEGYMKGMKDITYNEREENNAEPY